MDNTPKLSKKYLPTFIEENYEILTVAEMAEKSGHSLFIINKLCKEKGIVPITIGGQNLKKVKELSHLSLSEICNIVNLSRKAVRAYLKELGIEPIFNTPEPSKEEVKEEPKKPEKKVIQHIDEIKIKENAYLGPIARQYLRDQQALDIVNKVLYGTTG